MDNIYLRDISENDKDDYIKLQEETWINPKRLEGENASSVWENKLADESINSVITDGKNVIGFCGIKKNHSLYPEMEIEIFKKYQHNGFGFKALQLLMEKTKAIYDSNIFSARVMPDNYPCILLMRKIGAKPVGVKRNMLLEEDDDAIVWEKNKFLLNDNLIKVASVFKVDPKILLSHELVFYIDYSNDVKPQFQIELIGDLTYSKDIERNIMIYCLYGWLDFLDDYKKRYKDNE